ncbi:MAG: YciI family protein [Sphingobacteriales bacterium JAD_PAG50586_3]|nr:MAG: YciI family protein [Sphingobacteriales bacterium JAD_PAG50586_3]
MKKLLLLLALLITGFVTANAQTAKPAYDSLLAKKLGADDYGMKQYVMALLKKGPNRTQDSTTAANIQAGHMKNIGRMADEGTLVVAGPFEDDWDVRGIYIFNVATVEEAQKLTATDPAIKSGRLVMELHPFYCSAALMQVNAIHKTLQKNSLTD